MLSAPATSPNAAISASFAHRASSALFAFGAASAFVACGTSSSPIADPPDASAWAADADAPSADATIDVAGSEGQGDPGLPASSDASTPPGRGAATLLAEAQRELAAMKQSTYTHTTSVDEPSGTFDYDCSGFVDYALGRVLPDALATLVAATVKRPVASSFESFFASIAAGDANGRWRRVARVPDLAPGDVIAWLKPAALQSTNTGHVLVVRDAVSMRAAGEWVIPIIDATESPHGSSDSRNAAGATGLGTGTIVLLTDAGGAPTGYRWSTWSGSVPYPTAVALGHLD